MSFLFSRGAERARSVGLSASSYRVTEHCNGSHRVPTLRAIRAGLAFFFLGSATLTASAQEVPVPKAELQRLVIGRTISSGGSVLTYGVNGSYTFNGGNPGRYKIKNGKICVKFDSGRFRCDKIIKYGGRYFLIDRRGARFDFAS